VAEAAVATTPVTLLFRVDQAVAEKDMVAVILVNLGLSTQVVVVVVLGSLLVVVQLMVVVRVVQAS
jgi:hypothetical protein